MAALVGLGLISISLLPSLLRTPKPPPIPENVGFRDAELNLGQFNIQPKKSVSKPTKQAKSKAARRADPPHGASRPKAGKNREAKAADQPKPAAEISTSVPVTGSAAPVAASPVAAASVLPGPTPTPPPTPAPTTASTSISQDPPGDGSQEFAPR